MTSPYGSKSQNKMFSLRTAVFQMRPVGGKSHIVSLGIDKTTGQLIKCDEKCEAAERKIDKHPQTSDELKEKVLEEVMRIMRNLAEMKTMRKKLLHVTKKLRGMVKEKMDQPIPGLRLWAYGFGQHC